MGWYLVRYGAQTISHRRQLSGDAWCSVVQVEHGRWEWGVRVRAPGDAIGTTVAHGECSTWQNARAAADEHAARLAPQAPLRSALPGPAHWEPDPPGSGLDRPTGGLTSPGV